MKAPRTGRGAAGFTLAEILLVLTLTSIGFIAIINLQIGTINAVANARNMTEATNLAEHVIELIRSDAIEWTADGETVNPTRFPYLSMALEPTSVGGGSGWRRVMLSPESDRRVGSLGYASESLERDAGVMNEFPPERNKRYCVFCELTWILPDYLLRADVRVMWMRGNQNQTTFSGCPLAMVDEIQEVSSITIPATVMRNVFGASTVP